MSKKLPYLLTCLFAALSFNAVTAQEYVSVPISTGFNADVIANGVGAANTSTSAAVDGSDYVFMAANFQSVSTNALPTTGLPVNGLINSLATAGLSYQLAPLTGNNALRLIDGAASGTLTFATPTAANTLYMLGTTGNGPASVTGLVTFSDNTTQPLASSVVPDWFDASTQPIAASGFARLGRTSNTIEYPSGNPRLYQISFAILPANQSKPITSIQLTKTTVGGITSIFAFSADAYTSCPSPTNITYVSSMTGATVSWTAPAIVPSGGYDYYFSTSSTAPISTTTPTGSVTTNSTTVTGIPGQTYFFWVRSNCGGVKGVWKIGSFTVGQVTYTYTGADVSTNFLDSPTITSTTACPGDFAITVPPGYKIASVGTSYNMTSLNNGYMSEQRSMIACTTNSTAETALAAGAGMVGTFSYSRANIGLAVGLTGSVNFQMRAWRMWQGALPDCSTTYNKVDGNTWKMIVTYALDSCTTPATPTAVDQNLCPTATFADLFATGVVGAVYKWYSAPAGGTAIASTAPIAVGTYYVSQTIGTCESARSTAVNVTLNPTPLATAAPQTLCGGTTVANLTTTSGANIKWYTAATGGTSLAASTALVTGNYYVSQTVNGCESARATIAITINTTPPPTTATSQTFCSGGGSTVASLQATPVTGGIIKWYSTDTSTTPLATTALLGNGVYYVSQSTGLCESVRVQVQVIVASIVTPNAPTTQALCTGATVANLAGGTSQAATFKWYSTQASTTPLTADTAIVPGTYYVSQTIATCESAKVAVQVTITDVTTPVVADQELCAGATVASLQATPSTGATIVWYTAETGGTQLTATTALASGIYYAAQKINTCESGRDAVAVIVHDVVNAPVAAVQTVCIGSALADLSVEATEGATLKWYATNTATVTLADTTPVVSGTTYYVSQTVGNCEGARTSVSATFTVVDVPTTESLAVCGGLTFGDLPVDGLEGATFSWYTTLDGLVATDPSTLVTAGTFYVSQTVNGCESGRVPVAISIINTEAPAPTPQQAFCGEAFVSNLAGGATIGYTVNWYSPEGDAVAEGDVLVTGTYTVSQTANGCESQAMPVAVLVTEIPATAAGEEEQDFTAGETVADLELEFITGAAIQWYFLNEDVWIAIPATTPLVDGGVYGVKQTVGECESDIKSVTVNIILSSEDFALSNLKIYPNPSSDVVTIEGRETLSTIVVMNLLGQRVLHQEVDAASVQINIAALPQATYILQVYGANGGTASFKIVKQ